MIRRDFFKISIFTAAILSPLSSKDLKIKESKHLIKTTVAICGGGFAGLSAAKYLKDLNPSLHVTLIEKNSHFISCPLSNAYLAQIKGITYESLCFPYNTAVSKYKYNFINETIHDINIKEKIVYTQNKNIKYDYLIMAVGVDYNYKKLFKNDKIKAKEALLKAPPGLKPGSETLALKRMINSCKSGNFVISIPSQQYKCPPAPYERACLIAHYFLKNNIDAKVIIIDPRRKPAAKPDMFLEAFRRFYPNTIIYKNLTNFKDVDFIKNTITIERFDKKLLDYVEEKIPFTQACIIPANIANKLIKKAKLKTYAHGFAKLKQPTFRSVSHDDVYIIGDSQGEYPYPKSAQMANSIAYIVSKDISARLKGEFFDYTKNMPGNICYSMLNDKEAISITHTYTFSNKVDVSSLTSDINKDDFISTKAWFKALSDDIFGLN